MPLPERALISRIAAVSRGRHRFANRQKLSPQIGRAGVVTGIGDDCAVLGIPAGHEILVTTDFSLEGVHFRREWHPPESVGHRCLARGLSDIAAMGGQPIAAFLSLALPPRTPQGWVDRFLRGLLKLADEFDITLAGGDTAQSPSGVLADIVVLGSVPKGKAILRSWARPGDRIYVTGVLGGSAAALGLLYAKGKKLNPAKFSRHFFPVPRIRAGEALRARGIPSSMIDTSDGLSTDLSHICEASGAGAEVWTAAIPIARMGQSAEKAELKYALHGGEDYELLFTAPKNRLVPSQIGGVQVSCIGAITARKRMLLIDEDGSRSALRAAGWEHFR